MRAIAAFLLCIFACASLAQAPYPAKAVRFVIDTAPGGITDILGRMGADWLAQQTGRQFIVENRVGGSGHIAIEAFVKAPPDGYTLMMAGGGNLVIQPFLQKQLSYDPINDMQPVFNFAETPHILVVPRSLPVNTLAEFIAYARANAGKINYGSAGIGSPPHLAADNLARLAGIQMVHVPYKGVGGTLADLVAGRIQLVSMSLGSARPNLQAGTFKALATGSKKRLAGLPEVPTATEAGLPAWEMTAWFGLFAPKDTRMDIVRVLNDRLQAFTDDAKTRQRYQELGAEPIGGSPASFQERLRADYKYWSNVIRQSGVKLE